MVGPGQSERHGRRWMQVLSAGLGAPGAADQLHAEALRAAGLLAVVQALGPQPDGCVSFPSIVVVGCLIGSIQLQAGLRLY